MNTLAFVNSGSFSSIVGMEYIGLLIALLIVSLWVSLAREQNFRIRMVRLGCRSLFPKKQRTHFPLELGREIPGTEGSGFGCPTPVTL